MLWVLMFLWRNKQTYALIITKYPPYLFPWISTNFMFIYFYVCSFECLVSMEWKLCLVSPWASCFHHNNVYFTDRKSKQNFYTVKPV